MNLPKFLIGDHSQFPEDIFVIHLEYPRFIINLKDDDIELMDDVEDLSEAELQTELETLIAEAITFYDDEMKNYEDE